MMPIISIPAVLAALLAALNSTPKTLADAARIEAWRRALTPPVTRQLTNADLPPAPPAPPAPAETSAVPPSASATSVPPAGTPPAVEEGSEAWWRARMTTARAALDRDQLLADALQSRINALTTDAINRDDPAQKAQLFIDRQKALDELDRERALIDQDRAAIASVEEDARKQGVPPGWIRG